MVYSKPEPNIIPLNGAEVPLEQHWNADLLDTIETVIQFAQTMRWNGNSPVVRLLTTLYHTGVRLTKKAMAQVKPTSNA